MNGPDQILEASSYTTWNCDGSVRLREDDMEEYPPLSVPGMLKKTVEKYGSSPAMTVERKGVRESTSYEELYDGARRAAMGFMALGLERYHSVGILGFNAPEWTMSLLGSILAGGFGVGIYSTNSPEGVKYVANDSRANVLVVEDEKQLAKVLQVRDELPYLKGIVVYSPDSLGRDYEGVYTWKELMSLGQEEGGSLLKDRLKGIAVNQCCSLIYTSGTTGPSKGVMLSHDNVTWTARTSNRYLSLNHGDTGVSYLPLSHAAAQMMDIWMPIADGLTIHFCDKNALKGTLVKTLKEVRPTYFFGVPRVYEKMQEKMQEMGKRSKGLKRAVAGWAKKTGLSYNLKSLEGQQPSGFSYPIAKKLVFDKVKENLGLDKAKLCGVGAAPASRKTLEYFLSLDIPLYECYGMSESSGPQTGNRPGNHRFCSVGSNVRGCITKIHEPDLNGEGEICMSSRNVMMGYLFKPEKTKESIDSDGWLHSGDIGKEDEDGYFQITGRIKELIITAGGENIPPVVIEDVIKSEISIVRNAMVIGDKKKFLSCLLTLKVEVDPETMEPTRKLNSEALEWCCSVSPSNKVQTVEDFLKDPVLMDNIQKGMDKVNTLATSNAQRVQKFAVLNDDFSVSGGELGPTLKLIRHFVLKKYDTHINNFYNC